MGILQSENYFLHEIYLALVRFEWKINHGIFNFYFLLSAYDHLIL